MTEDDVHGGYVEAELGRRSVRELGATGEVLAGSEDAHGDGGEIRRGLGKSGVKVRERWMAKETSPRYISIRKPFCV